MKFTLILNAEYDSPYRITLSDGLFNMTKAGEDYSREDLKDFLESAYHIELKDVKLSKSDIDDVCLLNEDLLPASLMFDDDSVIESLEEKLIAEFLYEHQDKFLDDMNVDYYSYSVLNLMYDAIKYSILDKLR